MHAYKQFTFNTQIELRERIYRLKAVSKQPNEGEDILLYSMPSATYQWGYYIDDEPVYVQ